MNQLFNIDNFKLKNDLEVVLVKNKTSPVVSVGVLVKYGTADDDPRYVGVAHFLEHMMFKGTKKYPAGAFDEIIMSNGGTLNAYTADNYTFYYETVPLHLLEKVLELEADRLVNIHFVDELIESEKKVVQEEERMRMGNHPYGEGYVALINAQYLKNPKKVPGIGFPHHIAAYNKDNLCAAYKENYAPNNVVLIISGNLDHATLEPLVEKYFGSIPKAKLAKKERPKEPNIEGLTQYLFHENKKSSVVNVILSYPKAGVLEKGIRYSAAYDVAAYILAGNKASLFYKQFVKDNNLAVNVSVHNPDSWDENIFEVDFDLTPTMGLKALLDGFKTCMQNLNENMVNEEWFEKRFHEVKEQLKGSFELSVDGTAGAIGFFAGGIGSGFTADQLNTFKQFIDEVTLDEVKDVCKTLLQKPKVVMVSHPEGYKNDIAAF